jgi:hypothetical protein
MALGDQGLSYRLIARDLGLNNNTVMAIVQRQRAADIPHLSAYISSLSMGSPQAPWQETASTRQEPPISAQFTGFLRVASCE